MSSARDITRAAWPPRASYVDYPLGHTSGRPHQPELNLEILRAALSGFERLTEPGSMLHLPQRWSATDDWKDGVFAPIQKSPNSGNADTGKAGADDSAYEDDRVARHETPQYQTDADAHAAAASHDGEECLVCAGIDY